MVIRPNGFDHMGADAETLDDMFKENGHVNAYLPRFIPKYLSKEAEHVGHFAKECAIVTHYRLKTSDNGSVIVFQNCAMSFLW